MSRGALRLLSLSLAIGLSGGCAVKPRHEAPPSGHGLAACVASATIVIWKEGGAYKAEVHGNSLYTTERKTIFVDGDALEPTKSTACWTVVPLSSVDPADIQWVHVKDFDQPIFAPSAAFNPNLRRTDRLRYDRDPAWSEVEYPRGSGALIEGARVTYKVWVKMKNDGAPFEADPDWVEPRPRIR